MGLACFAKHASLGLALTALVFPGRPAAAGWFTKGQPIPDWGLQAAKTHVPDSAKDAASVILYDEYVETIDAQGRATEREREAIRILKPQGRGNTCEVTYDETQKVNYFRVWTIAADESSTRPRTRTSPTRAIPASPSCFPPANPASPILPRST